MKLLKILIIGLTSFLIVPFFSLAFADEIRYDIGARRDPMTPLVGADGVIEIKNNPDDLHIQGIIFDLNRTGSLVLINGDFYKEGQTINNSTIITIMKDRVILRQDDEERTLWIREEVVGFDQLAKSQKLSSLNGKK